MAAMNKEKVSVIIPLYNREDYIQQTIQSVIEQDLSDWKIYVVDDGSTDDSLAIVKAINDDRIVILQHEGGANKGQSASINLGLDHIEGEYIAILDSDDFWEKEKLSLQVDYLNSHPKTGIVYCNGVACGPDNEFLYDIYTDEHVENNNPSLILLNCYLFLPTNSLVRTSVFKQAGFFDDSLRAGQDHDMLLRIVEICEIAYINHKVFSYRRHGGSISENHAIVRWKNGFKILAKAKSRYPYSKSTIRKRKAVLFYRIAQCYGKNKNYIMALMNYFLAGLYDPLRSIKVVLKKENETCSQVV